MGWIHKTAVLRLQNESHSPFAAARLPSHTSREYSLSPSPSQNVHSTGGKKNFCAYNINTSYLHPFGKMWCCQNLAITLVHNNLTGGNVTQTSPPHLTPTKNLDEIKEI